MQVSGWLRDRLWRADDWRQSLSAALDEVRAAGDARRALDLGRALEHVEPDRQKALDAYLLAWRAGQTSGALAAARRVAREIRALGTYALLAIHEFDRTDDPAWLWAAAVAYLDAGQPDHAQVPLERARGARPDDDRHAVLLAAIEGKAGDLRPHVSRWLERGLAEDRPEHAALAARLARLGRVPDEERARLLRVALDRWPADDDVALLVEDLLFTRGDPDELLTFYKLRLGTRQGARPWAEEIRAGATRLCVRGVAPGLGLRLSRKGLEHAYDAGLVDVPGHLATWAVLADHGRAVRASRELMPLAVTALRLPLTDADRLWLARFGLAVAWRDAGDDAAARSYAAILAEVAPDHPDLREFVRDQVHVDVEIDLDSDDDEVIDADIAELALSLVYLDQHDGERIADEVAVAQEARKRTEAAAAKAAAPTPAPAPAQPAWMSAETASIVDVAQDAVAATDAAAEEVAVITAAPPKPIAIPTAALSALRRIGARMRVPTGPQVPQGGKDRAARVVVPVDVTVELDDGRQVEAMVRDLSTTGLFILLEEPLGLGAELALELRLPAEDALSTIKQRAWARVVRQGERGYGLLLIDPDPALTDALAAVCARMGG